VAVDIKKIENLKILKPPVNPLDTPLQHNYGLCERHNLDIFSEPLNVISSLLFFLVAYEIFNLYRRNRDINSKWIIDLKILNFLIICIGFGSTLFHMVPNYYTELLDISFIIIFINLYFICVMKRVALLNWFQVVVAFLAFLGTTNFIVSKFPNAMNDSIGYLSTMISLIFIAVYLSLRNRPSAKYYLLASLVGVASLFFRSIDNYVCNELPIGTHFLWHSCNAVLIYILMKQLVRSVNRRARMLEMAAYHGV